jgi:RimJ/RimL family protein N-acetyltransferase
VRLVALERDGSVGEPIASTPQIANVIEMTVKMYNGRGFVPPWTGYFALADGGVVGTCAFTAAPSEGRVEIAYFTFPDFEGRGVATAMARELIAIARAAGIAVFAHTLPQRSASTTILERLGFTFARIDDHPEDGVLWRWEL